MSEPLGGGASRSTEPASGTSAATDVSLREHLAGRLHDAEHRIDERDRYLREADHRLMQERDKRYAQLRESDQKLAEERRRADQLAIALQREVDKEHFAHLNEAAARSIEERSHFATRELVDGLKESFEAQIKPLSDFVAVSQGQSKGIGTSASVLTGVIAAVASVAAIVAVIVTLTQ